jgi:uncharacterized protein
VLENLARAYREQRATVEEQAEKLTELVQNADLQLLSSAKAKQNSASSVSLDIFKQLQTRFDVAEGGFGGAPKFPSTMAISWLLTFAQHFPEEKAALAHAEKSLLKMIGGGIYDVLGGGFSRYTVDRAWLVPHFEKMLYDNALLVSTLSEAYQVTHKPIYRQTIQETLAFVTQKMMAPEGGFYAAYDADSEGEEGKYYVWTMEEIAQIIDNETDSTLFCELYDVTAAGNFEKKNILNRPDLSVFERLTESEKERLATCRAKLFAAREKRVPPSLDDKQILAWNALMVTAYAQAYEATQIEQYRQTAQQQLDFLLHTFAPKTSDGDWAHTHLSSQRHDKNGEVKGTAFADDLAFLAESCLAVAQISGENGYLKTVEMLINTLLTQFLDKSNFLCYFTSEKQKDVLIRKKEIYDNATPSANSTFASVLWRMAILFDRADWRHHAEQMYVAIQASVQQYPTAFGRWAMGWLAMEKPLFEIAIVGKNALVLLPEILALPSPQKIVVVTTIVNEDLPLFRGRFVEHDTLIYVCQNYACQLPVRTVAEVRQLLNIA